MDEKTIGENPDARGRSRSGERGAAERHASKSTSRGVGAARNSLERRESEAEQIAPVAPALISQEPQQSAPFLNAAAPAFEPRSFTTKGSQPLVRTYAAVLSATHVDRTLSPPIVNQVNLLGSLRSTEPDLESTGSASQLLAPLTESKRAESKDTPLTSVSQPVESLPAIGYAYLKAAKPSSFLSAIAQTEAIRNAHAHPAPELTNIGPNYSPAPNRASFEKIWCEGRVRPRGFPSIQALPSVEATALGSVSESIPPAVTLNTAAPLGPVLPPAASTSANIIVPTNPIAVVAAAPQQAHVFRIANTIPGSLLHPAGVISSVPPRLLVFSTPPSLPGQRQPLTRPSQGSRSHQTLSASQKRTRSWRRRPAHLLSQPATSLLSGPPLPVPQFPCTPTKTLLTDAQTSTLVSPLHRSGDTPEQKKKIEKAMSSFRDLGGPFDAIKWGENQGQANNGESPEILTVPPQPVASYTTVGSLRPATIQQFTAPNRIQRDGTGCRPLQSSFQGRGHDNQFGVRVVNQQYNPGYGSSTQSQYGGMNFPQYGSTSQQQPGSSMRRPYGTMDQPGSSMQSSYRSTAQPHHAPLSQPRFDIPSQHEGLSASSYETTQQGGFGSLAQQEYPRIYVGSLAQPDFGSLDCLQPNNDLSSVGLSKDEKEVLHANGLSVPIVGFSAPSMRSGNIPIQNRDILPRNDLSLNPQAESFNVPREHKNIQQNNSIQQLARNTSLEPSGANNHQIATSNGTKLSQQPTMSSITSQGPAVNDCSTHTNIDFNIQNRRGVDQSYRFSPPGLIHSTARNQSFNNGQHTVSTAGSNGQVTTTQHYGDRSGRPEPLTAGPPGQRQSISTGFRGASSTQSAQVGNLFHSHNNTFQLAPIGFGAIRDTLPPDAVRQYYPNGLPNDMTGHYTPLPPLEMPAHEIRIANINRSFNSGLDCIQMTSTQHIENMAARNAGVDIAQQAQLHELQRISEPLEVQQTQAPLSVQQINDMDITEVTAHLTGPVFGSILTLADQRPGPNNPARLSRFAPGAAWQVDHSADGNRSFFGEDSGPTPHRFGRDPRHQP